MWIFSSSAIYLLQIYTAALFPTFKERLFFGVLCKMARPFLHSELTPNKLRPTYRNLDVYLNLKVMLSW